MSIKIFLHFGIDNDTYLVKALIIQYVTDYYCLN